MISFLSRYRNSVTLAIVLFVQLIGLAVQIKRQGEEGETRLLRYWAVAAITPIEKGVVHTQSWTRSAWTNYISVRQVRRENDALKQQLEQMRLEQVRLREDANQARRIQSLLAFKEQFMSKTVAAQVIGTSGSELSKTIYIDRGSDDGIKPNMPVITPDGIVGKVLRVYGSASQVLEITDQTSGVGAILINSRLQGILKGTPSGEINLNYIMADEKIAAGDQVATSGGDRIFPKGLPIGNVDSVTLGRDSFLNLRVRPSANLSRLEEVLVITDVELKEPDTKDLGPIRAADILAERLPSVPPKPDPQATAGQPAAGAPGTTTPGTAAQPNTAAPTGPTTAPKQVTSGAASGVAAAGKPTGAANTAVPKAVSNSTTKRVPVKPLAQPSTKSPTTEAKPTATPSTKPSEVHDAQH